MIIIRKIYYVIMLDLFSVIPLKYKNDEKIRDWTIAGLIFGSIF